jgi:predicted component of type VI protein secretion system
MANKLLVTLVFKKNANFSPQKMAEKCRKLPKHGKNRRKMAKIAENSDHNIGPS